MDVSSLSYQIALPAITFAGVVAAGLLARFAVLRIFGRWAQRSKTVVDDIILDAIRMPSLFWVSAAGLYLAIGTSRLPQQFISSSFTVLHILVILSVTQCLAVLASRLTVSLTRKAGIPIPATGLSQAVIKGTVFIIGILILLGTLGISVTPLITALGVGGLAVALALQDTLSNLFAGVHILTERSVRVGDFIKLESGEEGYVADIGWRTTKVRLLQNNLVVIPNTKLAQSIITNYHLPEKKMAVLISIGVSYEADPDRVEKVLEEEARKAAGEVPGLLSDPAPFVRFIPGFGESSLNFTLICHVKEFVDQYIVQHELRKRIFTRFKQEGIEIPYPQRVVHLREKR